MAKISFGSLVSDAAGTIGGTVYSHNASGAYARQWSRPRQPRSRQQTAVRAKLALLPTAWRTLTASQQTAWSTWAAAPAQARTNSIGVTYYLSGYQAYIAINRWRQTLGLPLTASPPTIARPTAPSIGSLNAWDPPASFVQVVTNPSAWTTHPWEIVFLAMHPGAGRKTPPTQFRFAGAIEANPDFGFEIHDPVAYFFGPIVAGQTWWARVYRATSEGYPSPPTLISTVAL